MVEAKMNEHTGALNKVNEPCKYFSFTFGMFKDALAVGRKKK
jgi:hypothetical protein